MQSFMRTHESKRSRLRKFQNLSSIGRSVHSSGPGGENAFVRSATDCQNFCRNVHPCV